MERNDVPLHVLIVDDDELVAETLARCCVQPDMTVVGTAANSASALSFAQKHQPDIVLMDHRLDGADGVDVARRLLELSPATKVLIVTGAASSSVIHAAVEAGCVGLIEKTMSIRRILPEMIRRVSNGESLWTLSQDGGVEDPC